MRMTQLLVCSLCVTAAAAACSTPAAYLAAPASDADLKNDRSTASQQKLRDKYALAIVDSSGVFDDARPKLKNAGAGDVVSLQDRNATDVLARDPKAAEAIDNWSFGMSTLGSGPRTSFMLGGALTGAALGYWLDPKIVGATGDGGVGVDLTNVALGGVVGLFASTSLLLAADALSEGQARVSLAHAVNAYNRDLDDRIAKGAAAAPPSAPPAALPASP